MLHRFPEVDEDGLVWLNSLPYVHNPNLDTHIHYRPRRYLKLIEFEDVESYFLENEPAQIAFDRTLTPDTVGITGQTIKTFGTAEHARQILEEHPPRLWLYILVGAIFGGFLGYLIAVAYMGGK